MHASAQHAMTARTLAARRPAPISPCACWAAAGGGGPEFVLRGGGPRGWEEDRRRRIVAPGAGAVPAVTLHARPGTIGRSAAAKKEMRAHAKPWRGRWGRWMACRPACQQRRRQTVSRGCCAGGEAVRGSGKRTAKGQQQHERRGTAAARICATGMTTAPSLRALPRQRPPRAE